MTEELKASRELIYFLSDFGTRDPWVGACKSLIWSMNPDVKIVDISHEIEPFNIEQAAAVLFSFAPYIRPDSIVLGVVDPGVGSDRRALAIASEAGPLLVGPDNGMFSALLDELRGARVMVAVDPALVAQDIQAHTFDAYRIFSPAAALLSKGRHIETLGTRIDDMTRLEVFDAAVAAASAACRIVFFDRFGTARLNVRRSDLKGTGFKEGGVFDVGIRRKGDENWIKNVPLVRYFQEVGPGRPLLIFDSSQMLSLSINLGSAREMLRLQVGDEVIIINRGEREPVL